MKHVLTALSLVLLASVARADAAATYAAKCKACHGADGGGASMFKQSIKGMEEAKVLKVIQEGQGKMKPVKIDDAAEVAKLVAGMK